MARPAVFALALAAAACAVVAERANATKRRPTGSPHPARRATRAAGRVTNVSDAAGTPAYHYAQLTAADCEAELTRREISFVHETADAVLAPVRLIGPLHGVVFRTDQSDEVRAISPYEIADCRLVLALDDLAEILSQHDIVEVRHYSIYRPPRSWPDGKLGAQHVGALAIDAGRFIDRAGTVLDVDRDFHGKIGAPTCGERAAPRPATPEALALRAMLCEIVDRRLVQVVLTPNYNRPHKNHFHLEVTAGVDWFMVH